MDFTKDFFNLILDFGDDWVLTNIEADHVNYEVFLDLEYRSDVYEDPQTLEPATLYDHTDVRIWRHLDILHYKSYIRCRIPRVKCSDGKVKQIDVGWADKHDRHTYDFEIRVIDLLKVSKNQTRTAEFMNCSFRLVNRIIHRSTERGLQRRNISRFTFGHISIDEKSFKKGHQYITVLSDPHTGVVLDVGENRDSEATKNLIEKTFTAKQLAQINTVSMDMWQPYIQAVSNKIPEAEIVHDKFHLIQYLNKAIDQIRRREVKDHEILKDSRYVLLKNKENLTQKQFIKYQTIKDLNLNVVKAYQIRENFKTLFDYYHEQTSATEILTHWAQDSFMNGIREINKVILMFLNHARGVVNALISNLNNAMAERLNGKIQEVKSIGRGYRKFQNFRNAILFFNGNLDLYPLKW